ncbi:hypothetical protein X975_04314, partial [Stegodyphus mimosarum]
VCRSSRLVNVEELSAKLCSKIHHPATSIILVWLSCK